MSLPEEGPDRARRGFVKRALYVPPAILTLTAAPAYAKAGSEKPLSGNPHSSYPGKGRGKGLEKKSMYSKHRL